MLAHLVAGALWCALALAACGGEPAASAATEETDAVPSGTWLQEDEPSTLPTPAELAVELPAAASTPPPELDADTVTDAERTPSDMPPPTGPPPPLPLANHSGRVLVSYDYMIEREVFMKKVLLYQKKQHRRFEGSSELTLLVAVILPGVLFFVIFVVIIANTATPMKVPYANSKPQIITPWMLEECDLPNVKCYPTYGQV